MCNAGVHQRCYGRELIKGIPNGDWFCDRCTNLKKNPHKHPSEYACDMCNDLKGIIVQYKNKTSSRVGWGHICCINWIPDIWFTDEVQVDVEGTLDLERYNLTCYICRAKKHSGSSIQCDYKNCVQPFHIRCAFKKGLISDYETMLDQKEDQDSDECFVFCDKHQDIGKRDLKLGGKKRLAYKPSIMGSDQKQTKSNKGSDGKLARKRVVMEGDQSESEDNEEEAEEAEASSRKIHSKKKGILQNQNNVPMKNQASKNGFKVKAAAATPCVPNGSNF